VKTFTLRFLYLLLHKKQDLNGFDNANKHLNINATSPRALNLGQRWLALVEKKEFKNKLARLKSD
jgi:hypothetical protein